MLKHFYRPQTKFRKGICFHKRVSRILSTGEGSASVHAGIHPPGKVHPPWADTALLADTSWADTPWVDTPQQQTATAADGTHPTGMHSC